jgi:hypothetical protein
MLTGAICGTLAGCGSAACSSPHGTTPPPPPGDGGTDPDATVPPPPSDAGPVVGTLRVDPRNPRYFTGGSGAIYLTGSHTWANFKDRGKGDPPPEFDYAAFLEFLVAHRHNFIRLWTWEQPHSADNELLFFSPFAWPRNGPGMASDGKPRFDLDQFVPDYFKRLHDRVKAAGDRGIYVAVMLFDGWDLSPQGYSPTGGFPMAAGNNINGVSTTPAVALSLSDPAITARQEAYVRKVIDTVNDLDNVLYEIANESTRSADTVAWQYHMIDFVKAVEAGMPKQHPVGMTSMYPSGQDADLYASHADWISPVDPKAPGDGRKVVLNDTDHSYGWKELQNDGPAAQRAWAWETLCRGAAPLFMDPYLEQWTDRNAPPDATTLDSRWSTLRDTLGYTQLYASKLRLEATVPSPALCSTGFCLAEPGRQYLVYQPGSGSFSVTMVAGAYRFEWFNPATGKMADTGMITLAAGPHSFAPPFTGSAVLLLLLP